MRQPHAKASARRGPNPGPLHVADPLWSGAPPTVAGPDSRARALTLAPGARLLEEHIRTCADRDSPAALAAVGGSGAGWSQSRITVMVSPSGSASRQIERSPTSSAGGSGSRHQVR